MVDVREDVLRPPHGTTPAAVKSESSENKGADQTAQMRRLICTYVVCICLTQVFSWRGSNTTRLFGPSTQTADKACCSKDELLWTTLHDQIDTLTADEYFFFIIIIILIILTASPKISISSFKYFVRNLDSYTYMFEIHIFKS